MYIGKSLALLVSMATWCTSLENASVQPIGQGLLNQLTLENKSPFCKKKLVLAALYLSNPFQMPLTPDYCFLLVLVSYTSLYSCLPVPAMGVTIPVYICYIPCYRKHVGCIRPRAATGCNYGVTLCQCSTCWLTGIIQCTLKVRVCFCLLLLWLLCCVYHCAAIVFGWQLLTKLPSVCYCMHTCTYDLLVS